MARSIANRHAALTKSRLLREKGERSSPSERVNRKNKAPLTHLELRGQLVTGDVEYTHTARGLRGNHPLHEGITPGWVAPETSCVGGSQQSVFNILLDPDLQRSHLLARTGVSYPEMVRVYGVRSSSRRKTAPFSPGMRISAGGRSHTGHHRQRRTIRPAASIKSVVQEMVDFWRQGIYLIMDDIYIS